MQFVNRVVGWLLQMRNRHFLVYDVCILTLTPYLALELRTDGAGAWDDHGISILVVVVTFLAVKLAVFFPSKLYHRYWRYASVDELAKITLACLVAVAIQTLLFFFLLRPVGLVAPEFPRSIPLIDGLLALMFVGGGRYAVRVAQRAQQRLNDGNGSKRVLIAGAGEAGLLIAEEMQSNPHLKLKPIGFVDDDLEKGHLRMRGLNVLGTRNDIPKIARSRGIKMVVIAIPKAPGKDVREIARICESAGIKAKVIPGFYELLDGVSVRRMRDVQLEDLLRRPAVQTDTNQVASLVRGSRVLVTGSGGSIGSELCRQLIRFEPAELVLLGHGENSLFLIEAELRRYLAARPDTATKIRALVADIRDQRRLDQVFAAYRPEIVYHAAAHKHVSLMEMNATEAVSNNVGGTRNLLSIADKHDVKRFVMISTDKAVNPTSIMGVTKRIAELLVGDMAHQSQKHFVAVRFGNVLGSRGSVVQIFRNQIEHGGPVTVTDPDAERFFMTIPEAVQLVLQSGAMGQGGEVFVLDMGEPVRIMDLAQDLIRLSGKKEGRDLDIVVTGLQDGEKLKEKLFKDDEIVEMTEHEKILVARNGHSLNGLATEDFQSKVDRLLETARKGDLEETLNLIKVLVPEFVPAKNGTAGPGAAIAQPADAELRS